MKKTLSLILVLALVISSATMVFAAPKNDNTKNKGPKSTTTTTTTSITNKEADQAIKNQLKTEKAALVAKKDELEAAKDKLEADYEAALASGNTELAAQLKTQLDTAKAQFADIKSQLKANIQERKALIKKSYTTEELAAIAKATTNITVEDPTAKVLDVTSVVSTTANFKFDTPPVIKGGRTLIPVRAITEGLGAEVAWNQDTQQVTITKDGTTITLTLGSTTALVNGEPVGLDTKANTMNNRTYVPLRFIMETFNKTVTYDDGTIEIEDGTGDSTYTGSAITTN